MDWHHSDYDRQENPGDSMSGKQLMDILEHSLEVENEMMRTYLITAERVHADEKLKERLQNFAEGNAKRTRQLLSEIEKLDKGE
jgi:hypothetical protein